MKKIIRKFLLTIFGYDFMWSANFFRHMKVWPNIKKPQFFNEKVRYRIKYDQNYLYSKLADKILVREYIKNKIGEEYLVPVRYIFDDVKDIINKNINFDNTVVKANHGAGMVLFPDAINDKTEIIKTCEQWMQTDFSKVFFEPHYAKIKPSIIVEESLCQDGNVPNDYKFHTFKSMDGNFNIVLQVVNGRFKNESRGYYLNGVNREDLVWSHGAGHHDIPDIHKSSLIDAIELSKKLCEDFNYVRVDWYVVGKKIYFGELTFTPGAASAFEFGVVLEKKMCEFWEL
ncbi:ATP-grasp fold amidoligase family protein [Kluyvera sichuanensis]|uniref:ATP-grasp fold amidoligase family protein n=1 Tax=Kluyvera sichuanensis TaxID=2725494 RepID=UPI0039F68592